MALSDEALVLACRRGDEQAWESLVKRYERLIYSIPRRAGLDESAAADVFQTVFAKLVENIDRIEQPDRIQAWLVTLARRESLRLAFSSGSTRTASGDFEAEAEIDIPDKALLADQELIDLERQHRVRLAVDSLDKRCQQLVRLLFYRADPPAYSEVAALMGVTPGSIGPTRARCLQKLLRILEKEGF